LHIALFQFTDTNDFMDYIDYYKVLDISKTATDKEIKKAYRKMARKYHPDVNPKDKDAEKRFKEINEANEVLSNSENRKKYDKYGENWQHAEEFERAQQSRSAYQGGGDRQYSGGFSDADFGGGDYSDFFETMFGGSREGFGSRQVKFRGQDFNAELHLNLEDVYTSQKQKLTVSNKKIRITIPAGIENGQTIKIAGHGGEGANGGPKGDLYITFVIDNNTKFKREKGNLYLNREIDLYTAVLGGEITVDTMNGKVKLNVKPETQNGSRIKLNGKGFPIYKKENQFGDLYITYSISTPKNLSKEQKELFQKLRELQK